MLHLPFLSRVPLWLASVSAAIGSAVAMAAPTTLPLPFDWYPESVATGPDGSFYVGSWRQGAVVRLRPGAQRAQTLVQPGANGLANGQGVLVDAKRDALWVCSGNVGFTTVPTTPSALKRYSLATGASQASYPMPDDGYCNDLAQDRDGNLYVTDSSHPRVLRLAAGAQALAVWKEDALLAGTGSYRGLNGIAIDGNREVYVSVVSAASHLLRITLGADGSAGPVTQVEAPRELKNVDAIRTWKPGRLVLFESNAFGSGPYGGQITVARIEGDRLALRTVVAGLNDPSSGVVVGRRVYFIESKYPLLTQHKDDDAAVPRGVPFDLQSRELPDSF
jgi:sugar lactone lactonase YvrE